MPYYLVYDDSSTINNSGTNHIGLTAIQSRNTLSVALPKGDVKLRNQLKIRIVLTYFCVVTNGFLSWVKIW